MSAHRMNDRVAGLRLIIALVFSVVTLTLAGCGKGMDDLDAYINETKAKPAPLPKSLPEIKPYEVFVYQADTDELRSPFTPDSPRARSTLTDGPGVSPDSDRSPEYLEQFPLDSLTMVGTLAMNNQSFGLIQTTDGLVHRVLPGNFMGQNYGRITTITESEVGLVEIISDGIGGYLERDAAVSLQD